MDLLIWQMRAPEKDLWSCLSSCVYRRGILYYSLITYSLWVCVCGGGWDVPQCIVYSVKILFKTRSVALTMYNHIHILYRLVKCKMIYYLGLSVHRTRINVCIMQVSPGVDQNDIRLSSCQCSTRKGFDVMSWGQIIINAMYSSIDRKDHLEKATVYVYVRHECNGTVWMHRQLPTKKLW